MKEILHIIQSWIMLAGLLALAAVGLTAVAPKVAASLRRLVGGPESVGDRPPRRSQVLAKALSVLAVVAIVYYGGSKGTRTVNYPRTDPDIAYLSDAGSYVTNDLVHINFTRKLVPSSAPFLLDCRPNGSTNDADWANVYLRSFGEFTLPLDIPFENATNYEWMAYTTWTPGASVQTNGVWHCYWGTDDKFHAFLIPVKTAVRLDGDVIATPKSKENAK